ncbi:MAG: hypothetical protein LBQ12_06345 [Deltaproteobacteria bacterium]|jgi:hypothetical protein|nr:hypothetical protein [Deltaproteobacteria bacterium]
MPGVRVCPRTCPLLSGSLATVRSEKAVNGKRRADMAAREPKALFRVRAGTVVIDGI